MVLRITKVCNLPCQNVTVTSKIAAAFAILYQSHFQRPTRRLKFRTRRYKREQTRENVCGSAWTQIAVGVSFNDICMSKLFPIFSSFSFKINFESSLSFQYLLWLKDSIWFLYISLFKCACCHAYVVFYAICVVCSDCGPVNYLVNHAFFPERACFLVPYLQPYIACALLFS